MVKIQATAEDIKNVESEAGVIASIILHPEFTFYSETLKPNHFTDDQNAYLYYAVSELAKRGIEKVDAYNITNVLNAKESTKEYAANMTIQSLREFIDLSRYVARESVEEYMLLVDNVLDAAFRRDTFNKLEQCKQLCLETEEKEIEKQIYSSLDNVLMSYSSINELPKFKDKVDEYWAQIVERQGDGFSGIPFKFPTLNEYATIEPGELFIFGAEAKQGKSMMLLNCAVDLLRQGYSVLYIDSELNSRMFTCRLIAHLTGIEFKRVKSGKYSAEEGNRIKSAIDWIKTRRFTHQYMPMFDEKAIYSATKKMKHTDGLDVVIIDYFKSKGEGDAFASYSELGRLVDLVKNQICGNMNIAGIGAAQATSAGRLADSAKIGRNASTIAIITEKTAEEIATDGVECGNKKLRITLNRNGMQMTEDEYIDLKFDGNHILYEEAQQHIPTAPF